VSKNIFELGKTFGYELILAFRIFLGVFRSWMNLSRCLGCFLIVLNKKRLEMDFRVKNLYS
jgi:hypothetical protein